MTEIRPRQPFRKLIILEYRRWASPIGVQAVGIGGDSNQATMTLAIRATGKEFARLAGS